MQVKRDLLLLLCIIIAATVHAQKYANKSNAEVKTQWEGVSFSSNNTLQENIAEVESFSFLNDILKDKKLQTALANEEMITVFLPLDAAFMKLSEETREALLADKTALANAIKLLVVPGRLDEHSIRAAISKNNGIAFFNTLNGGLLGAKLINNSIVLFDSENNTAIMTAADFYHKNGFFHIIDGLVFTPHSQ